MYVKLTILFLLQDGEHFTLPYHVLLDRTRKVRDELLSHRQRLTSPTMSVQPPGGARGSAAGSSQQQRNDQEIFVSSFATSSSSNPRYLLLDIFLALFGTVDTGKGWNSQVCPLVIGGITTCHRMRHSLSLPTATYIYWYLSEKVTYWLNFGPSLVQK